MFIIIQSHRPNHHEFLFRFVVVLRNQQLEQALLWFWGTLTPENRHTWLAKTFINMFPQLFKIDQKALTFKTGWTVVELLVNLLTAFIFSLSNSFQKFTLHCLKWFQEVPPHSNLFQLTEWACGHHSDEFLCFSYSLFQASVFWNKIYNCL